MIRSYSDYIKINEAYTGSNPSPSLIYWSNKLNTLLNNEWTQISTTKYTGNIYEIKFRTGDEKNNYYSVLVEKSTNDIYYLEEDGKIDLSKIFQEKLNNEFWKHPLDYYKNLKYAPKCLGDISYLSASDKYNV